MNDYVTQLDNQSQQAYQVAKSARAKGKDFSLEPEIHVAKDLADKVEGLVEIKGLAPTVRELLNQGLGEEEVAFKLVDHIISKEPDKRKAADQSIRAALAFITQGAVSAPIEGIARVEIKKNPDDTEYLAVYFSGPIRAAGGTAEALCVVVADYARRKLGLSRYKPTSQEVGRYWEEIQWYHRYQHLQYFPSQLEVETIVKNVPVCIEGEPTEKIEVANNRDLPRVETNRVRGGLCLVLAEGVAQKAPKLLKRLTPIQEEYGIDWSWLESLLVKKASEAGPAVEEELSKLEVKGYEWVSDPLAQDAGELQDFLDHADDNQLEWLDGIIDDEDLPEISKRSTKYLQEIPAGRPVFSYPSRKGGFALRYGRTRASGYAAVAMNPATMHVLGGFVAIGTQIRVELPGKAAIVTPCDTVDGPIVRLKSGEVLQIDTIDEAEKHVPHIESIIHAGDLLVSAGDFLENNQKLLPGKYCAEWWARDFESKTESIPDELKPYTQEPYSIPPLAQASEISKKYGIPLHPAHLFCWHELTLNQLNILLDALEVGTITETEITLKTDEKLKPILEALGVSHTLEDHQLRITAHAPALLVNLNYSAETVQKLRQESKETRNVLDLLNKVNVIHLKKKMPTTIGARMGRPEKAKPRKMVPPPHSLFPTGLFQGRVRDLRKITDITTVDASKYFCEKCRTHNVFPDCPNCGSRGVLRLVCKQCGRASMKEECIACGSRCAAYANQEVNIPKLLEEAAKNIDRQLPDSVKGILGMGSQQKMPEHIEKGILRAVHNVFAFKDGTARFDSTNAPLTHFTPKEVKTPVAKLKELGYTVDYKGAALELETQILELQPQDIILSDYPETSGMDYFLRVTQYLDELLEKFYHVPPYYNAKKKSDLVGHLVIGLAPHTSTGIVGRIIGSTQARVNYAHPAFHAAKRRDADGDEDAFLLLLDAFLNFSRAFLPDRRGGRMDAPLVLSTRLNLGEVDDEVYDVDIHAQYPLSFYESAEKQADPNTIKLKTVSSMLNEDNPFQPWEFTKATTCFDAGPLRNTYTEGEMVDKLFKQLDLAEKLRAVDEKDVAERILRSHFIPDMRGNLRTFTRQKTRCTRCNTKYRRPPLKGVCLKCGNNLTLTVHKGTIEKYLLISKDLALKYNISPYLSQQIHMLDLSIESLFGKEAQATLKSFA